MTANYEFALIGETEVSNNTSYTMQTNFTFDDFSEFFITAKLRAYVTGTTYRAIDVGFTESNNTIPNVSYVYASAYYGGYPAHSQGYGAWWGGTSNAAFRPHRISDRFNGSASDRWTICHWQIAHQANAQGANSPWVGQCMAPYNDGRLAVYGGTYTSNNTSNSGKGGIYVRCNSYPFASGSKLTVWGHANV